MRTCRLNCLPKKTVLSDDANKARRETNQSIVRLILVRSTSDRRSRGACHVVGTLGRRKGFQGGGMNLEQVVALHRVQYRELPVAFPQIGFLKLRIVCKIANSVFTHKRLDRREPGSERFHFWIEADENQSVPRFHSVGRKAVCRSVEYFCWCERYPLSISRCGCRSKHGTGTEYGQHSSLPRQEECPDGHTCSIEQPVRYLDCEPATQAAHQSRLVRDRREKRAHHRWSRKPNHHAKCGRARPSAIPDGETRLLAMHVRGRKIDNQACRLSELWMKSIVLCSSSAFRFNLESKEWVRTSASL